MRELACSSTMLMKYASSTQVELSHPFASTPLFLHKEGQANTQRIGNVSQEQETLAQARQEQKQGWSRVCTQNAWVLSLGLVLEDCDRSGVYLASKHQAWMP